MITVIDYGIGNLRSVQKSFERAGIEVQITSDPTEIKNAEKLVLPGVGHFAKGMDNLNKSGLVGILNKKVLEDKTPILGICLGMQLMTTHSEEGDTKGLNWVDAETVRFDKDPSKKFKVPHIGWNDIQFSNNSPLCKGIKSDSQYYFVHTYYVLCKNKSNVITETEYGTSFHSGFQHDNIYGVQFHPEKSYSAGLQMLKNFSEV